MSWLARLRAWATARHFAQLGILALLLATIRTAAEYLRAATLPADKLMAAVIIAASFCLASTLLHFFHRDRLSIGATIIAITALIIYKFWQLPQLA